MSDCPGKHKYKYKIWIQHRASHRWDNDGWTYHIYHMGKRPNRYRCQFHKNKGKVDNNVPDLTAYKRSNNKVFCILAENLGEVVDLSTKTHLDSVAVILAEATQIVNRWCPTPLSLMVHLIKSVQQAVLINPLAFTDMMHMTTIADQSGHGYYCVLLLNLMVLRLWLHWKILQLPIYSLYSLSGEGQKSGLTLQT